VIVAVGEGTGAGWAAAGLAVSLVYVGAQLLVMLGRHKRPLPWMLTGSTRAAQTAVLVFYCAFSLFFLIGLILA
jgi:hypothetical protein